MNISNDLKLNEALSLFILPSRFIGAQTLFFFTLGQCKTLCSENVFTDALSGNSHRRSPISHILQILSSPPLHIYTICTFTSHFPFLLSSMYCSATVKSFAKKSLRSMTTFCYFHKCLSEDPNKMFLTELHEKLLWSQSAPGSSYSNSQVFILSLSGLGCTSIPS